MDTEEPENRFFAVTAIATGVNADSRELAALAPALDSELGDAQEIGDLTNGHQVGEIVDRDTINFLGSANLADHRVILRESLIGHTLYLELSNI